jgi:transcriptional regulator with XRE-family HTH domain|tara:strand:- start:932 stop:1333 length:402 start_codon:yes stop_codon:yes gene_type:complete
MANTRGATEIDQHVGARLRVRRQLLGMSQQALGQRLGVTFQQVQKYERGANRIGASRLFFVAQALDVPVGYFFEGLDEFGQLSGDAQQEDLYAFISSPDGVAFALAFLSIEASAVRRKLIELARVLGGADEDV